MPRLHLDRRSLIAAGAGLALPAIARAQSEDPAMSRLYPIMQAVIAAWQAHDVEGVLAHVTDDIVWRNSSGHAPAIRGKAEMRKALQAMAPQIETNKWRIFDYAESKDRLFMEGVDEFWLTGGQHVAIPYAGVLEFRGDLIREWREYFDGRISAEMRGGAPMTDEVAEMIGRPVAK